MAYHKSNQTRIIFSITILVFFSMILITVNAKGKRNPNFVERMVSSLIFPFQKVATGSLSVLGDLRNKYFYPVGMKEENEILKSEMANIEGLESKLIELQLENKRLRSLLEYKENSPYKMAMAQVVGYDSTNWNQMVTIDKGSSDGIKRKMPVVANGALVGKIESVFSKSSKVLLMIDIRNAVDAMIQESRAKGVVAGTNGELCDMKYVSLEENVEKGFNVISSGLGTVYPKGLLIGVVEEVIKKEFGLFQVVSIKPSVDLDHLEEVMVILE